MIFYWLLGVLLVVPPHGQAEAADCSDIYPGAEIGPPPEWSFWGDGSACFVRWFSQDPDHEEKLFAQCRDTAGARFVHFERDNGAGHSICIFKILSVASPGEIDNPAQSRKDSSQELRPTEEQKDDAENPLVRAEVLVKGWNENCLKKERAKESLAAAACWKDAAKAIQQLTMTTHGSPIKEFKEKLQQLRSTWLGRADQLEGRPVASGEDTPTIQPATYGDGSGSQNSPKPTVVKKHPNKQESRKKTRRKIEISSSERPPKRVLKKRKPKEAALKVTTNYTKKDEPRLNNKKPKFMENQKSPTISCLLFSALC